MRSLLVNVRLLVIIKELAELPTKVSPMLWIIQTFRNLNLNSACILDWIFRNKNLVHSISSTKCLLKRTMDCTLCSIAIMAVIV